MVIYLAMGNVMKIKMKKMKDIGKQKRMTIKIKSQWSMLSLW